MAEITLTIDGKTVKGELGDTILEVCEKNGIDVPTLCHYSGLTNRGSCRMCVVQIEGARAFMPACTTPATDGMVVETKNDVLHALRRSNLELLLSERNHFCMFCEMSGDCELQSAAYEHGIDHVRYSFAWPAMTVDTSRQYFIFDQNRCILCRRCVRACEEKAGHAVLGVKERGSETMIIADLDVPFGESTCTSCGTCLQVCPTGALIDKRSAYAGKRKDLDETDTTCTFCSIGCAIKVLSRDGHPIRVEGLWGAEPSGGVLCVAGRFEPFYDRRIRITKPMIKQGGDLVEDSWENVIDQITAKMTSAESRAAFISGKATVEAAKAFKTVFGDRTFSICPELPVGNGELGDIDEADCIFVVGADLSEDFRVAGSFVKRAALKGTRLVTIGSVGKDVENRASERVSLDNTTELKRMIGESHKPVILFGPDTPSDLVQYFRDVETHAKTIALAPQANARGLASVGLTEADGDVSGFALVLLADDVPDERVRKILDAADFSVVVASYFDAAFESADVVLPSQIWSERNGTYVNTEGKEKQLRGAIMPPDGIIADDEIAQKLSGRI